MSKKFMGLMLAGLTLASACGQKSSGGGASLQTRNAQVQIPGSSEMITVPQTILTMEPSFGIKTLPVPVSKVNERLKKLARATAKVMNMEGSSGTGFFISEDGLFLTNEHVIEIKRCKQSGCPGTKLVRDYHLGGEIKEYTQFEVLAQADSDEDLDFTLLRVKLKDGEKVPYLPLELREEAYDFSSELSTYKVFGHPGGATLKVTNVKPIKQKGFTLEMLGLLIGGNSGGPMINEQSGKVVGLVKAIRPSYVRIDAESSTQSFRSYGTNVKDIIRHLQNDEDFKDVIAELNPEKVVLEKLDELDAEDITLPEGDFAEPSKRLYKAALRKDAEDPNGQIALAEFERYIGSSFETPVLDLMLETAEFADGKINQNSLQSLLRKQIMIGRPLRFSENAQKVIAAELNSGEESAENRSLILWNYFNPEERNRLEKKCINDVSDMYMGFLLALLNCGTLRKADGSSMVFSAVEHFKRSEYKDADDFRMPMTFGIIAGMVGYTPDAEEKAALIELAAVLEPQNNDVETIMSADAAFMDLALGVNGFGAYKNAYPAP